MGLLWIAGSFGCAAPVASSEQAIRDGELADVPGVVAIVLWPPTVSEPLVSQCTGVLVAPRLVLTAAHCVAPPADPGPHAVVFGPDLSGEVQLVDVAEVGVHPAFDPETLARDLAWMRLGREAPVAPIARSEAPLTEAALGRLVRIVGFGGEGEGIADGRLRAGEASVSAVGEWDFDVVPAPALSCRGDSGGPLLSVGEEPARLVGITSHGDAACEESGTNADVAAEQALIDDWVAAAAAEPIEAPDPRLETLCSVRCEDDEECPFGTQCEEEGGRSRCVLAPLPAGELGPLCETDAECGSGICAREPFGASRCLELCGSGGGCQSAPGRSPLPLLVAMATVGLVLRRRRPVG